jgi:hypothetical protein
MEVGSGGSLVEGGGGGGSLGSAASDRWGCSNYDPAVSGSNLSYPRSQNKTADSRGGLLEKIGRRCAPINEWYIYAVYGLKRVSHENKQGSQEGSIDKFFFKGGSARSFLIFFQAQSFNLYKMIQQLIVGIDWLLTATLIYIHRVLIHQRTI